MAGFIPDPAWPTIVELATMLWGLPVRRHGDEVFFGAREARKVNTAKHTWKDFEKNEGGGYLDLGEKAGWKPPPRTKANGNGKYHGPAPWDDIDRVYQYQNRHGALILEVVRTISRKPRFRQRRPDGYRFNNEIKWKWGVADLPGHDCLLYRVRELLDSAKRNAMVFVCEGEKDVDNLMALGIVATCNIGGAGKWRAEYAEAFAGRTVVVLQDNDDAGRSHVAVVARALFGVAASVQVLALPDLPEKGDVSDWLAAGGTVEALGDLVREVPQYDPPQQPPPPPPPTDGPGDEPDDDGEEPPNDWDQEHPPQDAVDMEAGALITEQFAMRTFIAGNREELRFNHSTGTWLTWGGNLWKPDDRKMAFAWALELCRELAANVVARDPTKARLVIEKVRFSAAVETGARAMPPFSTSQNDWDADRMLLGCPDGVVDLRTGEFRAGTREDMISRTTSVTPSHELDCPTWEAFLDYAMHGDDKKVRFLQRYFGYCLTGLTKEEKFVFLFGPGGAGKGTFMETVAHIMGDYAGTVPMEMFAGQQRSPLEYYRADMAGKRLLVANEPERNAFWAEAFIKETTGGDTLSGRFPMGRVFRFKPTHKMALSGNHMPRLRGRSTGMERRLLIPTFDRLPDEPDTDLKAKLLAEAPGILRWLIEGCLAWQKIGLQPPDSVLLAGAKYFEGQDAFARWIDECCILGKTLELTPTILRNSFNEWAKANGELEMSGNAFSEALDMSNLPITRGRQGSKRWVRGIGLNVSNASSSWNNP